MIKKEKSMLKKLKKISNIRKKYTQKREALRKQNIMNLHI